nr:VWA domain-containing protein [Devosia oryziradicis]
MLPLAGHAHGTHIVAMGNKDPIARTTGGVPRQGKVSADVAAFVSKVAAVARPDAAQDGRLLFALDATMSRQPTWDLACSLQAEMFKAIPKEAALQVQLLYFRGFGECRASKWVADASDLARLMTGIDCRGGNTQIGKVFAHARTEHGKRRINAVVYVGDAIEESVDELAEKAGQLGLFNCPIFLFQEGRDSRVEAAFRDFARLTEGAYARFDAYAPQELAALLRAVAAYASGGRDLLKVQGSGPAQALLAQLPR